MPNNNSKSIQTAKMKSKTLSKQTQNIQRSTAEVCTTIEFVVIRILIVVWLIAAIVAAKC